jgi:hypothetical protein
MKGRNANKMKRNENDMKRIITSGQHKSINKQNESSHRVTPLPQVIQLVGDLLRLVEVVVFDRLALLILQSRPLLTDLAVRGRNDDDDNDDDDNNNNNNNNSSSSSSSSRNNNSNNNNNNNNNSSSNNNNNNNNNNSNNCIRLPTPCSALAFRRPASPAG